MQRKYLAAAVAMAPLLGIAVASARAQTTISGNTTTPVATATANNGAPSDLIITGTVIPTTSGAAVTLNSNNSVTIQGSVGFSNVNDAVGLAVRGGFTGQIINTGEINLNESYTATVDTSDGLNYPPFAQGENRFGIQVTGTAPFNGSITDTGTSTIQGNTSEGIDLQAPITGSLLMTTVTPSTTSGTIATLANGSIVMTGDNAVGLNVESTSGIGGDLKITAVSATGVGAQAVVVNGAVGGEVDISGAVTATGYETTTRNTNPSIASLYLAEQMQQGGPALTIGASVGAGIIVSAPPFPIDTTVNVDNDGDGVPDTEQGTGSATSYGAAPAIVLGGVHPMNVGLYVTGENSPQPAGQGGLYGFIIQGNVTANGIFDPSTSPNLPAVVPATGIQIGVGGGGAVTIAGGMFNSGNISAIAYQANATAIQIGTAATATQTAGVGSLPVISNVGTISAASTQVNNALVGAKGAPAPVTVDAIVINAGSNVASIVNNNTIVASLTGTSGVGGNVGAIIDNSGSVTSVTNTGQINALLNQTVVGSPMPGATTAIDIGQATAPQSITQSLSPLVAKAPLWVASSSYTAGQLVSEPVVITNNNTNALETVTNIYEASGNITANTDPQSNPTVWRVVATADPTIAGDIYFGNGGSTLSVTAGTVVGNTIQMGSGTNTLTVNGPTGTAVSGSVLLGANNTGTINLNVLGGTLTDNNPLAVKAGSINVGANGVLVASADPVNHTNTDFKASGASTFANGAQVGLTFLSLQTDPVETYTILQTTGSGTLSVGTLGGAGAANAPYLYTAATSSAPGQILVTVTQRTPAQLGFNKAEGSALDAILTAIPNNPGIEQTILAQTTQAGLKSAYDQLLPNQGQGIFEALDAAAEAVSALTAARPDAGTPSAPNSSLWLQEVNERVDRDGVNTVGSAAKVLGLIGGWEANGVLGGAVGLSVSYFNAQEQDSLAPVDDQVVASFADLGAYYRLGLGPFTFDARGSGGYGWFSGVRRFVASQVVDEATSKWGGLFADGHVGIAYEQKLFGSYYIRPEISGDYLYLAEGAHKETGGGAGFDLDIASRVSSQASAQAILVLGTQFGTQNWIRPEFRIGYREVFAGDVGETVANFTGGSPFVLVADPLTGGWATIGFSLKAGTPYSYIALEGDFDYRPGQERYDIRIAGRSAF
jgi:hypothetical protein